MNPIELGVDGQAAHLDGQPIRGGAWAFADGLVTRGTDTRLA